MIEYLYISIHSSYTIEGTKTNQNICSSTIEGTKTKQSQSICSSTIEGTKTKRSICSPTFEGTKTKQNIRSLTIEGRKTKAKYSFLNYRWFAIASLAIPLAFWWLAVAKWSCIPAGSFLRKRPRNKELALLLPVGPASHSSCDWACGPPDWAYPAAQRPVAIWSLHSCLSVLPLCRGHQM